MLGCLTTAESSVVCQTITSWRSSVQSRVRTLLPSSTSSVREEFPLRLLPRLLPLQAGKMVGLCRGDRSTRPDTLSTPTRLGSMLMQTKVRQRGRHGLLLAEPRTSYPCLPVCLPYSSRATVRRPRPRLAARSQVNNVVGQKKGDPRSPPLARPRTAQLLYLLSLH